MGILSDIRSDLRRRGVWVDRDQAKDIAAVLRRVDSSVLNQAARARNRDVLTTVEKFRRRVGEMG